MKSIFINKESKLRSGWAIFFAYILYLLIGAPLTQSMKQMPAFEGYPWLIRITQAILLFIIAVIFCKFALKENIQYLGLKEDERWSKNMILGIMLGGVLTVFMFLGAIFSERCILINDLDMPQYSAQMLFGLVSCLMVAIAEEIFYRAYVMNSLKQVHNPIFIVVVAAMVYSFNYVRGGSGLTFLANITIIVFALLLCYMYYRTESLWLTIGFNFGWRYMGGTIFSLDGTGVYNLKVAQEGLISGGAYGPHYGILAIVLLLICFLFINIYVFNIKKMEETKAKMQAEHQKMLEDFKQHKEKESKYKCHEDVYEDMYDGFVPIDDMNDEDMDYGSYDDRD